MTKGGNFNAKMGKDSIFESTQDEIINQRGNPSSKVRADAEKEMTTGWQFAT